MPAPITSPAIADDVDLWPTEDVATAIVACQISAIQAIGPAVPALARAAEALAARLRAGGRMAYAGAGSSGLIAHLDALELPGTYGIAADRVPVVLAGGRASLEAIDGLAEDDTAEAEHAIDALELGPADGLVALAASGSTPFTVAAVTRARARGAFTVGIACRAATPLLAACNRPILVATPAEVVAGSTRMAAGTAQKCVLNILSTAIAMRLGHGYRGLMVNMHADNAKLRERAIGIVATAAGADRAAAATALEDAGGSIKAAIVQCVAGLAPDAAREHLAATGGDIRCALREASGHR